MGLGIAFTFARLYLQGEPGCHKVFNMWVIQTVVVTAKGYRRDCALTELNHSGVCLQCELRCPGVARRGYIGLRALLLTHYAFSYLRRGLSPWILLNKSCLAWRFGNA